MAALGRCANSLLRASASDRLVASDDLNRSRSSQNATDHIADRPWNGRGRGQDVIDHFLLRGSLCRTGFLVGRCLPVHGRAGDGRAAECESAADGDGRQKQAAQMEPPASCFHAANLRPSNRLWQAESPDFSPTKSAILPRENVPGATASNALWPPRSAPRRRPPVCDRPRRPLSNRSLPRATARR